MIFPPGWNGSGWARIFEVLSELISFLFRGSGGKHRVSLSQGASLNKGFLPPLPPPPLGCCPKCGFSGEPSCFLRLSFQAGAYESFRDAGVGVI